MKAEAESDQLKILMISHHRRGKAAPRSQAMARELVRKGHLVTLLLTSEKARASVIESEWDGVKVVEAPDLLWGRLRSGWDPWGTFRRQRYLRQDLTGYHLVHSFETRPASIHPALSFVRRHNLPLLTDWNDWWGRGGLIVQARPRWYRFLLGWLETHYEESFRCRADGLTVISTALASRAIGLGLPSERICYLPGGVQLDRFQVRPKEACREQVGLDARIPVLGFSSLDSYLDIEIAMQALAIVARRLPEIRLLITGTAGGRIRSLAKKYGVQDHLLLTGYLSDDELPWYLGCADVFLLPFADLTYNVGRWPNKMGEYMALGRPTISNPVGDIKTLFEQDRPGLLAEWDPTDFARKILDLLLDPALAKVLGANARSAAVEKYDWRILVEILESFYRRVRAGFSGRAGER